MTLGRTVVLAAAAVLAACGGSSGGGTAGGGTPDAGGTVTTTGADGGTTSSTVTITIRGMAFSPENPTVAPGSTVQVVNDDASVPHSMTSESTAGSYRPGSVGGVSFDTGIFTGTRSFTIPANAAVGTVIPFYCQVHGAMMVDAAKLQLTIGTASTTPSTAPAPAPPTPGGY